MFVIFEIIMERRDHLYYAYENKLRICKYEKILNEILLVLCLAICVSTSIPPQLSLKSIALYKQINIQGIIIFRLDSCHSSTLHLSLPCSNPCGMKQLEIC